MSGLVTPPLPSTAPAVSATGAPADFTAYMNQIRIQATPTGGLAQSGYDVKPFGTVFSPHMFVADYINGEWKNLSVVPYGQMSFGPALSALNYGQTIFEGMKAFRDVNGTTRVFRPDAHLRRLNSSAQRLCMPPVPEGLFIAALRTLLNVDKDWTPADGHGSLYIRPLYFATEEAVGVHPSESYRLVLFTCPVMAYYAAPLKVWVAKNHFRATEGGVGFVKTAGNYAAAMDAGKRAKEKGYNVVLWLEAASREKIEEFSTMNAFFVIDDAVVTPELSGNFLEGITRGTLLQIFQDLGTKTIQRALPISEVLEAGKAGRLKEAFGTGTAAVVAPVKMLTYDDQTVELADSEHFLLMKAAADHLSEIRSGRQPDLHNWLMEV